jgi:zeta-carotene desaturase
MGAEGVSATLLPELARLLPPVQDTPLLARRLLVHGGATFAVPPGGESRRLPARCPDLCGIYLAGEEIQTGWPSTMESAVRAGALAAQAVLASFS